MSTVPEFRSIGKELEDFATSLCPYLQKALFLMFFGLLFGMGHYCLLVVATYDLQPMPKYLWFAAAVWCIFNIIFNYIMTVLVEPGTPTDIPQSLLFPIRHTCRKCGVVKPPRSHHCSICNKCVIQMDRN
jgi:hypothetical protein